MQPENQSKQTAQKSTLNRAKLNLRNKRTKLKISVKYQYVETTEDINKNLVL